MIAPTLDTFQICEGNRLAALAAEKIIEDAFPGVTVFHGAPGCGKTHLATAITDGLRRHGKAVTTPSRSSEIDLQNADVLVIDDLQRTLRISAKWTADLLGAATDARIPVIATARDHPGKMNGTIEDGCTPLVSSRAIEIGRPDVAGRRWILDTLINQISDRPELVSGSVLTLLAPQLPGDGHALLGAARRLAAEADLLGEPVVIERARSALSGWLSENHGTVTVNHVRDAACDHFGIRKHEIISHGRKRGIARPRQIAMYVARDLTTRTLPEIGRAFGDRDPTTVHYACQRVVDMMRNDREIEGHVKDVAALAQGRAQ